MWLLLITLSMACASCATLKRDSTVCAEYRDLRCVAGTSCSFDRTRGCKACQCAEAFSDPANPPAHQ